MRKLVLGTLLSAALMTFGSVSKSYACCFAAQWSAVAQAYAAAYGCNSASGMGSNSDWALCYDQAARDADNTCYLYGDSESGYGC
jgi:hypothetical protein